MRAYVVGLLGLGNLEGEVGHMRPSESRIRVISAVAAVVVTAAAAAAVVARNHRCAVEDEENCPAGQVIGRD